ncbi:hypothetical protein BDW74DRAFT_178220 [Aspergillus multicolor]|uniref:uncharacterized protein n=1 Tax=Aspergillus multicolor TaxID=41759 RepID=UPI003CCE16FA
MGGKHYEARDSWNIPRAIVPGNTNPSKGTGAATTQAGHSGTGTNKDKTDADSDSDSATSYIPGKASTSVGATKGATTVCKRADAACERVSQIAEIKTHLDVQRDTCLFYSGRGEYGPKAYKWRKGEGRGGYKVLSQMWDKDSKKWPGQYRATEESSALMDERASQAVAVLCSGTVYVILPSDTRGTDWYEGSVWAKYEWPNLGPDVTKVVRVNPDNDRGRGD